MHLAIMSVAILDPAVCAACQNGSGWSGWHHARCLCGQMSAHLSRAGRKIWHQEHRRTGRSERGYPPSLGAPGGQRPRLYLVPTGDPSEKRRPPTARSAQALPLPEHAPDVITVAGFSVLTPPPPRPHRER